MELFAIPEAAIGVFERLYRLRITIHDLRGGLWPQLRADRFHHAQAVCQAVKMRGAWEKCNEFDVTQLRRQLPVLPEGRFHVCHAGLVEWVVPVFERTALAAEMGMSASRASHVVRQTCGASFRELLIDARLNTAMGLLRASELPVLEVSVRSGFADVAHFHRIFGQRVGTTPRKYRVGNQT